MWHHRYSVKQLEELEKKFSSATGRWYCQPLQETISLHYASCGHFRQPAPEADHHLSLCLGNCAAVHALFSVFSVHYLMPVGAGHQIIKERLLRGVAWETYNQMQHSILFITDYFGSNLPRTFVLKPFHFFIESHKVTLVVFPVSEWWVEYFICVQRKLSQNSFTILQDQCLNTLKNN